MPMTLLYQGTELYFLAGTLQATMLVAWVAGAIVPRRKVLFAAMAGLHGLAAIVFFFIGMLAADTEPQVILWFVGGLNAMMLTLWLVAALLVRAFLPPKSGVPTAGA
jgi:hypothetical protein